MIDVKVWKQKIYAVRWKIVGIVVSMAPALAIRKTLEMIFNVNLNKDDVPFPLRESIVFVSCFFACLVYRAFSAVDDENLESSKEVKGRR